MYSDDTLYKGLLPFPNIYLFTVCTSLRSPEGTCAIFFNLVVAKPYYSWPRLVISFPRVSKSRQDLLGRGSELISRSHELMLPSNWSNYFVDSAARPYYISLPFVIFAKSYLIVAQVNFKVSRKYLCQMLTAYVLYYLKYFQY